MAVCCLCLCDLGVVEGCYSNFDDPNDIIPLKTVGVVKVAEMWRGPTGSFKDIALSVVGRLVDFFLKKCNRKANIVVATTGDTGSAAIHSVLGSKNINIIVWYPRHGITHVQELQMTTIEAPHVQVVSADGTADATDVTVRKLFADQEFASKHNLMTLNSINVGRIIAQAVHFTYLYLKLCPSVDREVTFCVPSGGMGNSTGGVIARTMGVPLRLVCAVNENDIADRALRLNDFSLREELHTPASALDNILPYNLERVFYYLCGQRADIVRDVMETLEKDGRSHLPTAITEGNTFIDTARVDTRELFATMKRVWEEFSYAICPHTAVAMQPGLKLAAASPDKEIIVMATATPAKFPEVMERGGVPVPRVESIERLFGLSEHKIMVEKEEDWEKRMREEVMSFDQN